MSEADSEHADGARTETEPELVEPELAESEPAEPDQVEPGRGETVPVEPLRIDAVVEDVDASEEVEPPSAEWVRGAVEAVLLVVDEPVSAEAVARAVGVPVEQVAGALGELSAEYADGDRGIDLREAAGGWRLYTRERFSSVVEQFVLDGQQARLTRAALETLAVVAYRQPVTRARVAAIRGVGVDSVMRTLLTRGLVTEVGNDADTGGVQYGTTSLFLERLGLDAVDQLPSLAPLLPDITGLSGEDFDLADVAIADSVAVTRHVDDIDIELDTELDADVELDTEPAAARDVGASADADTDIELDTEPATALDVAASADADTESNIVNISEREDAHVSPST